MSKLNNGPEQNGPAGESSISVPLDPPPRPVPWQTPVYLVLITTWVGWLLLLTMGWLFWNYCAFGADAKAALFRAPLQSVTGTVTQIARTRLREGTGGVMSSRAGGSDHMSTQPIYAVRYTYPLPSGSAEAGTSYIGGDSEDGVALEFASSSAATQEASALQPGMTVPVEYVRSRPTLSRVHGMRSNVYPAFVLISLCIPAGAIFFMLPGLRNFRRIRFLLASGVVDKEGKNLEDPASRLLPLPINGPAAGWLGIRDGQLHAPSAVLWVQALLLPALAILANGLFVRSEWADIVYTWHTLLAGG